MQGQLFARASPETTDDVVFYGLCLGAFKSPHAFVETECFGGEPFLCYGLECPVHILKSLQIVLGDFEGPLSLGGDVDAALGQELGQPAVLVLPPKPLDGDGPRYVARDGVVGLEDLGEDGGAGQPGRRVDLDQLGLRGTPGLLRQRHGLEGFVAADGPDVLVAAGALQVLQLLPLECNRTYADRVLSGKMASE